MGPSHQKGRNSAFDIMMKAAQTGKRGPDQLSSPSCPPSIMEPKKSKSNGGPQK